MDKHSGGYDSYKYRISRFQISQIIHILHGILRLKPKITFHPPVPRLSPSVSANGT